MRYRALGKTGFSVSEIGYGGWGIGKKGWIGADDKESLASLNRAIDLGLNFIDTALVYGDGHSERLIGQVVRGRSERVYVATKVPPKNRILPAPPGVHADEAFPGSHIVECTEQSLSNLGIETIDIQQFHVWSDEWIEQGDWLETVQRLKEQGKIQHFGISINDHQPWNALRLIKTGVLDTVEVIYNMFDQSPEDELLQACRQYNVGVIVRAPLDEGGLTGKIRPESVFDENDFRTRYFRGDRKQEVFKRVQAIASDLEIGLDALPETALRYILSSPDVSTVIPGMRSVSHVDRNVAISDGHVLSSEQLQKLKAHRWVRDFYKKV